MTWKAFHFPATIVLLFLSAGLIATQLIWHINIIEVPLDFLVRFEESEIDDILTLFCIVGIAFFAEQRIQKRREQAKLEEARIEGVHRTMLEVEQVVSDFVTQVKMLRADARKGSKIDALVFEEAVTDTMTKLTEIGGLRDYLESQLAKDARLGV